MLAPPHVWSRRLAFVSAVQFRRGRSIPQNRHICVVSTARSVVILGGSSGVGLETTKYLKTKGVEPRTFSRRTGHDFAKLSDCLAAVGNVNEGVAVCVGAGRRQISCEEEITLYKNIASALRAANAIVIVAVVRSLVLSEVTAVFANALSTPWVILRPGAMDGGKEQDDKDNKRWSDENLLVTADIRCNGLVSRRGVARVVGDLLLARISLHDVNRKVLGVYDQNRMVSRPEGCTVIGADLWCDATN